MINSSSDFGAAVTWSSSPLSVAFTNVFGGNLFQVLSVITWEVFASVSYCKLFLKDLPNLINIG